MDVALMPKIPLAKDYILEEVRFFACPSLLPAPFACLCPCILSLP
jgi:hypothetical protein